METKPSRQAAVARGKFTLSHTIWATLIVATLLAGCSTQQPPKLTTVPAPPAGAFPLNLNGAGNSGATKMPGSPAIPSYDSVVQQFPNSPPPPVPAPTWPNTPGNGSPLQLSGIAGGPQSIGSIPSQVSSPKAPPLPPPPPAGSQSL